MNTNILTTDVQDFINSNLKSDISKLIFKGSPFTNISIQELANQIQAKQKSEKKLPTWFATKNIYYPPKISIEQTSSEITAKYKSELITGKILADISGGFGVDSFYFSKLFETVFHCEINTELSEIVNYNANQLNVKNIRTQNINGVQFIQEYEGDLDCIYIDPSRRDTQQNKVFLLRDCTPNVPDSLDILFSKSNQILIKTSPLLDLSSAINELSNVKEIHIVAVNNEVKELLFLLEKDYDEHIDIKTVNILKSTTQKFNFQLSWEKKIPEYSLPLAYLYEPNTAVLKSGAFNEIAIFYKLKKLHNHSHLYTSNELISEFPGRSFKIEKTIPYNKKIIQKEIPEKKANITVRNFGKSVEQIRKETKIKSGGDVFIFATKLLDASNVLIVNTKIK
ncbi:THUMP-like domain-containing protein [Tenacibaculum jejuense]|uniref:THUMP-like domain-containing protein n=1 Tax=Tenacibaculum jejuense TaxID=584609 RepID=UPI000BA3B091|nr:SAM-dependent methyltransferase [Tenacibaculum jejuense]